MADGVSSNKPDLGALGAAALKRWTPAAPGAAPTSPAADGAAPAGGAGAPASPADANQTARRGTGSLADADLGEAPWDQAERAAAGEALAGGAAAEAYEGLS